MSRTDSNRSQVGTAGTVFHETRSIVSPWQRIVRFCITPLLILSTSHNASAQMRSDAAASAELTIDATQIVSPVSPTLYGLMTEEINHSYEGGLYAEMVQNRTFRSSWEGV